MLDIYRIELGHLSGDLGWDIVGYIGIVGGILGYKTGRWRGSGVAPRRIRKCTSKHGRDAQASTSTSDVNKCGKGVLIASRVGSVRATLIPYT